MTVQDAPVTFWHAQGDPRERFPDLIGILPEENYEAWRTQGLCLCGCGEPTAHRRPERPERREINYWLIGHANTVRSQHGLAKGPSHAAALRHQEVRLVNRHANVVILSLVRDYIDQHHRGSIRDFCRTTGLSHDGLCKNLNGTSRLTKRRAKVLLLAIGEKPHPDLG